MQKYLNKYSKALIITFLSACAFGQEAVRVDNSTKVIIDPVNFWSANAPSSGLIKNDGSGTVTGTVSNPAIIKYVTQNGQENALGFNTDADGVGGGADWTRFIVGMNCFDNRTNDLVTAYDVTLPYSYLMMENAWEYTSGRLAQELYWVANGARIWALYHNNFDGAKSASSTLNGSFTIDPLSNAHTSSVFDSNWMPLDVRYERPGGVVGQRIWNKSTSAGSYSLLRLEQGALNANALDIANSDTSSRLQRYNDGFTMLQSSSSGIVYGYNGSTTANARHDFRGIALFDTRLGIGTASPSSNTKLQIGTHTNTVPSGTGIFLGGPSGGSSPVYHLRTGSVDNNPDYGFFLKTDYSGGPITSLGLRNISDTDILTLKTTGIEVNGGATISGSISASNLSGTNTGDQNASQVEFTPSGELSEIDVQGAITELASFLSNKVNLSDIGGEAVVTSSGTAHTFTTTSNQALDFGTTDPVLTIEEAGTWEISAEVVVFFNGATFGTSRDLYLKLRRTNNTAADLANAERYIPTGVITTFTGPGYCYSIPVVNYITANTDDEITICGLLTGAPSAGSVQATEATIRARKIKGP